MPDLSPQGRLIGVLPVESHYSGLPYFFLHQPEFDVAVIPRSKDAKWERQVH